MNEADIGYARLLFNILADINYPAVFDKEFTIALRNPHNREIAEDIAKALCRPAFYEAPILPKPVPVGREEIRNIDDIAFTEDCKEIEKALRKEKY